MKMKSPFATQGKNTHFSGTLLRHLGMYCQKPYIRTPHKAGAQVTQIPVCIPFLRTYGHLKMIKAFCKCLNWPDEFVTETNTKMEVITRSRTF